MILTFYLLIIIFPNNTVKWVVTDNSCIHLDDVEKKKISKIKWNNPAESRVTFNGFKPLGNIYLKFLINELLSSLLKIYNMYIVFII